MRLRNRRTMTKRLLLFLWIISFPFYNIGSGSAQEDASRIRVSVVLVQLNVAVTDGKGNYVSGLRPEDFSIVEDTIPQRTATFEEGNEAPRKIIYTAASGDKPQDAGPATVVEAPGEPVTTADAARTAGS